MKILVVGGGSGGHVTPVIAVIREIWKQRPRAKIEFWTDKKYYDNVRKIAVDNELDLNVRKVCAGKLRRYTNFKFLDYLEHFDVVLANIADAFRLMFGFLQSFFRLVANRPDVIFLKGGYTCLPVGMAARELRIPYVSHDSDPEPGLTKRAVSKKTAKTLQILIPFCNFDPEDKAVWTGIPVSEDFRPVTAARQKTLKKELGFDPKEPLLVVTGGSLGAEHINLAIRGILPELLKFTGVILVAGRERYPEMLDLKEYEKWEEGSLVSNFLMLEFSGEMYKLFGAADIVVSRAGASTITELSSMGKPVIMVPNQKLPGHHQVKNAEAFMKAKAAIVVRDEDITDDPQILLKEIKKLAKNSDKQKELAKNLRGFAKDDAAERIADMIVDIARK